MARRAYYEAEIDNEDQEAAEELDRALIAHQSGLHDFAPRPAFGSDPSQIGWPPTLPVELAMRLETPRAICQSYGIRREEWDLIRVNPTFVADLKRAVDDVAKEGGSFKARARLQAAEMLKESWRMVHDSAVPAAVRADLIKFTVKAAGLDASKDQGAAVATGSNFAIQINLG